MVLSGKCKKAFEKYLIEKWKKDSTSYYNIEHFKLLPFPMQYGVYVDFFDSLGIYIEIMNYINLSWQWSVEADNISEYDTDCKTRSDARTEGIKKANEIHNDRI